MSARRCSGFAILILLLASCGGGPVEYHVSGTVTYKGQPLPAGHIAFNPDYLKKNDGYAGFAHIKDGKFDTKINGRGVIGGPYNIVFTCYDGKPGNELPLGNKIHEETIALDLPLGDSAQAFILPTKR